MRIAVTSAYRWMFSKDNYGSLFQALALQSYLKKNGHIAFMLREEVSLSWYVHLKIFIRTFIVKLMMGITSKHFIKYINYLYLKKERHKKFKNFAERYLSFSQDVYNMDTIKKHYPDADIYIVGSDQVWSGINDLKFLNFGKKETRRISYAASMPWGNVSATWNVFAKKTLRNFDYISVREQEGVKVCEHIGLKDVNWVIDPSALIDKTEYIDMIKAENVKIKTTRPIAFVYLVNIKEKSDFDFHRLEVLLKDKYDIRVVLIQEAVVDIPFEYICTPSPAEWLALFNEAQVVITNSFHGVMFSLIFEKDFFVFYQKGMTTSENCRFTSILSKMELSDRILDVNDFVKAQEMIERNIDWKYVSGLKNTFIEESKKFLDNSIK